MKLKKITILLLTLTLSFQAIAAVPAAYATELDEAQQSVVEEIQSVEITQSETTPDETTPDEMTQTEPISDDTTYDSDSEADTKESYIPQSENRFIDVDSDKYYYESVVWAAEKGITSGTSDTTFSPNNVCTRAQIVTFLWNSCGSPNPGSISTKFTDVSPNAYYYQAVQWAVQKGITAGTTETTFSPEKSCTRSQAVTFLWRAAGCPAYTKESSSISGNEASYFYDISQSKYYYDAVQWATEHCVTSGTGDNAFSPNNICTRAQIVTFLYHYLVTQATFTSNVTAPQLNAVMSDAYDRMTVTWYPSNGSEGYTVYRRAASSEDWIPLTTLYGANTASYTDTTAVAGVVYYYTVCAYYTVNGQQIFSRYNNTGICGTVRCFAEQQLQYRDIPYTTPSGLPKGATIASGGCGPSSVCNLGNNLLGWNTSIPQIAQIAVDSGARYNGGTNISTLLGAVQQQFGGFTYQYTSNDDTAFSAVQSGAMAVIHTSGTVKSSQYSQLLSSGGHFLCLLRVTDSTATIVDSYSYDGKWTANNVRREYITQTDTVGIVQCPLSVLAEVVDYYYIVNNAN
ncbi:MAG: S-layer homology domain-containing protein [Eubacteriales bacterium]|nr:S-layer homology domain-containing protein [Eubacteriales bacterium]